MVTSDCIDVALGANVKVGNMKNSAARIMGGQKGTVTEGDKGIVVELYTMSASGQPNEVRVLSKDTDDNIIWEANFLPEELIVLRT